MASVGSWTWNWPPSQSPRGQLASPTFPSFPQPDASSPCPPILAPRPNPDALPADPPSPLRVWKARERGEPRCVTGTVAVPPHLLPHLHTEASSSPSGSQLTLRDLASFQPQVADALEMPLGNYTLYSPPPPAGGAILSFILNVLQGEAPDLSPESCPAGNLNSEPSAALSSSALITRQRQGSGE